MWLVVVSIIGLSSLGCAPRRGVTLPTGEQPTADKIEDESEAASDRELAAEARIVRRRIGAIKEQIAILEEGLANSPELSDEQRQELEQQLDEAVSELENEIKELIEIERRLGNYEESENSQASMDISILVPTGETRFLG
jgi:DNA repair exonuclease SbcCD ATPase subunit